MDRGLSLSAVLASSPSSPLSITVHWCFSTLFLFSLFLSPSLVGLGKRAACPRTSGQDWWLVNSISQHCRPHWCRTKSIRPSKKSYTSTRSTPASCYHRWVFRRIQENLYFIPFINFMFPLQFTNIFASAHSHLVSFNIIFFCTLKNKSNVSNNTQFEDLNLAMMKQRHTVQNLFFPPEFGWFTF